MKSGSFPEYIKKHFTISLFQLIQGGLMYLICLTRKYRQMNSLIGHPETSYSEAVRISFF